MRSLLRFQFPVWPFLAWSCVALAGVVAPFVAMVVLAGANPDAPLALVGGPILAVGLMGAGMIAAAVSGRMWVGVVLALLTGLGLTVTALALGMPALSHPLLVAFAFFVAGVSFAARGSLFARSASARGWWIAVSVVAGEAAILMTAFARPDTLPGWLLALLPAQWASLAIEAALAGSASRAASAAMIALAGTAAATLIVVRLWPRRWPYLIMFTAWLGLSVLVWLGQGLGEAHPRAAIETRS